MRDLSSFFIKSIILITWILLTNRIKMVSENDDELTGGKSTAEKGEFGTISL